MNKTLLAIALFGLAAGETSAQQIGRVARVEPVRYEKRDGRLKILSYVKLSEAPARKTVLQLGDEPLAVEAGSTGDSLLVWLPMIGKSDVLTLRSGRKVLSSKAVEAPIPDDWGYFRNGTIHIIQSSHQDIAWMDTPEYCRTERIEDIIIPALDIMREDPNFTFEMEQTLNLMEFLEAHPERRDEVIERYKEGRFVWGATYNQPYEGLASGEQLVRQAYYASGAARTCPVATTGRPTTSMSLAARCRCPRSWPRAASATSSYRVCARASMTGTAPTDRAC